MDYFFASWHHQDSLLMPPLCGEEQLRTVFSSIHFPLCFWDRITHENFTEYGEYQCNYLQSNQANIFILEFLFGFVNTTFIVNNY